MPGFPVPLIKFREDDQNGFPLAGGKLFSLAAGLSTPLPTWTTQALDVENENPVILDASGRASIFIPDNVAYKFILQDALGNEIWSVDEVRVPPVVATPAPPVMPPGSLVMFGGTITPTGWLACDGASVSTTTYAALFAAISYTFGGSGPTFKVPDLRQRFPLGKAVSGTGVVLGSTGGTIDHTHTVPFAGWAHGSSAAPAGYLLTSGGATTVDTPTGEQLTGIANPPYIALNFLIKT